MPTLRKEKVQQPLPLREEEGVPVVFKDRRDAGQRLLSRLADLENEKDAVVIGLARGGVIVADEVARGLGLPLEVMVAKKLGAPGNPELAVGAIAEGVRTLSPEVIDEYGISDEYIEAEALRVGREIHRRTKLYRHDRPLFNLGGKTVVLIDDGIATGATMGAAVRYAKAMGARETMVAVPVASERSLRALEQEADRVVCLCKAGPYFFAVGEHYTQFPQVSDAEVVKALRSAHVRENHRHVKKETR